jgi:Domain of unknown function (DUF305)
VVISNRQLLIVSAAVAAALGVGIVVGVQLGDDGPAGARVVQPGAPGQAGRTLSPGDLNAISPPAHDAADTLFMQQMIPHHAQALEMTALVDDRTRSEDLALLAERIEASQQTEIDQMQAWLTERHEEVPSAHDHHSGHHPDLMPGMLTEDQLLGQVLAQEHPGELILGAPFVLHISDPGVERQVLGHPLVRIEVDRVEPGPARGGLGVLQERATQPAALPGRVHGDVVDQEALVGDPEHEHPDESTILVGHDDVRGADDIRVVLPHRAGLHADALDVVPVRGIDQIGHRRRIGRYGRA